MKHSVLSQKLWKSLQPLLPAAPRSRKGGRPRLDDKAALNGILFVLTTGIPWEDLPRELGFGSDMTCWRRLPAECHGNLRLDDIDAPVGGSQPILLRAYAHNQWHLVV
jgi:transposase